MSGLALEVESTMPPRKEVEEERDSQLEVEPAEVPAAEVAAATPEVPAAEVPAAEAATAEVPATEVAPAVTASVHTLIETLVVAGVEALIES